MQQELLKDVSWKLKKWFVNTNRFSNRDTSIFFLLLGKSVHTWIYIFTYEYIWEYMDDWGKFNETPLLEKEDFYSHLNMEDITDATYMNTERVCKVFEIKNLSKYHDFHVQSNALLIADVLELMFLEIYET